MNQMHQMTEPRTITRRAAGHAVLVVAFAAIIVQAIVIASAEASSEKTNAIAALAVFGPASVYFALRAVMAAALAPADASLTRAPWISAAASVCGSLLMVASCCALVGSL